MKIRTFIATTLICFGPQLAKADIRCIDASGYYGYIRVAEKSGSLEIIAKQGYSIEISQQLGFPQGAEAAWMLISMPNRCLRSDELLHCQGPAIVNYGTWSSGPGKFEAIIDFQMVKESNGHTVSLEVAAPSLRRTGRASHHFGHSLGECKEL